MALLVTVVLVLVLWALPALLLYGVWWASHDHR